MIEIQRADPRRRRQAWAIAIVLMLTGAALIAAFEQYGPELGALLSRTWPEPRERLRVMLAAVAVLACAPPLGLATYLWSWGGRVIRAQRYPPPGACVVRDTPVLRDRAAVRRGRLIRAFAAAFAVAALGLLYALWRLWTAFSA